MKWNPEREAYWRQQPWRECSDRELERRLPEHRSTIGGWRVRVGEPWDGRRFTEQTAVADEPSLGNPATPRLGQLLVTPPEPATDPQPEPDASADDPEGLRGVRTHATPEQRLAIDAMLRYGSILDAALALKVSPERLHGLLSEAKRKSASAGWSPGHDMTKEVPKPFVVKGISTYYGADGELRGQWIKTKREEEHRLELILEAVQDIAEPFRGAAEPVEAPGHTDADLLAVYPIGDVHLGLYAWAEETGQAYDLEIAERTLVGGVDALVREAPPADQALIISVGDFFHTDSVQNKTSRAGNVLDVDTRWPKVLGTGIRAMRRIIEQTLAKHKRVRVILEIGNHDDHSSIMLAVCLAQFFERDERVEIDTSPDPFHWYRFGACLIGVTHGSEAKPAQLPGIMATDRARDWGETKHRHWYTGHIHHDKAKDHPGCSVESLRAVTPQDSWHHRRGYRGDNDLKCDTWHREWGRINRHTFGLGRLVAK